MISRLSRPTVILHWSVALLFLGTLGLGLYFEDMANGPEKFELLTTHKSFGIIVFLFAVLRLAWRIKEGMVHSVSRLPAWQTVLATSAHYFLLLATIAMPLSGIIMSGAGGHEVAVFGLTIIPQGEKIEWLSNIGHFIHLQSVNIIIVILTLHILGALKHQFMDKDGTISRMLGQDVNKG